jgi:hypothetical protein
MASRPHETDHPAEQGGKDLGLGGKEERARVGLRGGGQDWVQVQMHVRARPSVVTWWGLRLQRSGYAWLPTVPTVPTETCGAAGARVRGISGGEVAAAVGVVTVIGGGGVGVEGDRRRLKDGGRAARGGGREERVRKLPSVVSWWSCPGSPKADVTQEGGPQKENGNPKESVGRVGDETESAEARCVSELQPSQPSQPSEVGCASMLSGSRSAYSSIGSASVYSIGSTARRSPSLSSIGSAFSISSLGSVHSSFGSARNSRSMSDNDISDKNMVDSSPAKAPANNTARGEVLDGVVAGAHVEGEGGRAIRKVEEGLRASTQGQEGGEGTCSRGWAHGADCQHLPADFQYLPPLSPNAPQRAAAQRMPSIVTWWVTGVFTTRVSPGVRPPCGVGTWVFPPGAHRLSEDDSKAGTRVLSPDGADGFSGLAACCPPGSTPPAPPRRPPLVKEGEGGRDRERERLPLSNVVTNAQGFVYAPGPHPHTAATLSPSKLSKPIPPPRRCPPQPPTRNPQPESGTPAGVSP